MASRLPQTRRSRPTYRRPIGILVSTRQEASGTLDEFCPLERGQVIAADALRVTLDHGGIEVIDDLIWSMGVELAIAFARAHGGDAARRYFGLIVAEAVHLTSAEMGVGPVKPLRKFAA